MRDAHADAIALCRLIDRLLEHLHRLDLARLLELREVDLHPDAHRAREHGAGDHCALPFDREAVVDGEEQRPIRIALWKHDLRAERREQLRNTFGRRRGRRARGERIARTRLRRGLRADDAARRLGRRLRVGIVRPASGMRSDGDHWRVGEFRRGEGLADARLHLLKVRLARRSGQHVQLVEHHDEPIVGDLADYEALSSLGLDPLANVDDEQHQVDDLCAADDRADERRVAWAVDEGDLHLLVL